MPMNTRLQTIAEEAERLSVSDRVRLVEHLLATLDKADPEIDRAWAEECARRRDRYLRGETTALDAEDVLARYLKP
jgi:putative addiction module component (TIGR02574 family)